MSHQPIQEEARVPSAVFKTRVRDDSIAGDNPYRWQDVATDEVFEGKKVVVFGLPGAFTPVCSTSHAPDYSAKYDEFKKLGIDEVYCLAVNDAYVMKQWADKLGIRNVIMLPDGNAEFTSKMGMLVKKENLGFGLRSWRYSMLVEDGVIKKLFIEPGLSDDCPDDPLEVSNAETMLIYLKSREK